MLSDAKDILKFYITWLLYKTNTAMQSSSSWLTIPLLVLEK